MNTRSCQHCGQPADDQAMLCSACGNALPPPLLTTTYDQTLAPPATFTGEVPATLAPPTIVQPTYVQPTQQMSHTPLVITVPQAPQPAGPRRGSGVVIGMILGFAVIGALVVIGVKVLEKRSDDKAAPQVPASAASTTVEPADTTAVPAASVAPVVESTVESTTNAPVIAEVTTAPPIAVQPTVPTVAGPGVSQVLRDPMSDGVPFAAVAGSFSLAQQLADALAADDWNTARQLEPAKAGFTDAQYAGYKGLDRASLILVDARPEGDGYRNLVVSVANENDGTKTSLFCLEWSASAATGFVVQHTGVVGKLTTLNSLVSSDAVVSDPTLLDLVMRKCVWS